jgi:predicted CoA-binding protein
MGNQTEPTPTKILQTARNILLIDWPDQGLVRSLLSAGFTVFAYSPDRYTVASIADTNPENINGISAFPPRNASEKGYLVFSVIDKIPCAIDIVNVYRPEDELEGIISKHVLPFGTKTLWLHPPLKSNIAKKLAADNGLNLIQGYNIADEVAKRV